MPDGYFFESANRVFYQNSSTISAKYLSLTEDVIGAFPQAVDFKAPDVARDTINRWVEKKTKNKIKDLISDGVLDELVRMVLVNAVYFKADWKTYVFPNVYNNHKLAHYSCSFIFVFFLADILPKIRANE